MPCTTAGAARARLQRSAFTASSMPLSSLLCGLTLLLLLPFITHAAESDSGGVDGGGEVDASSSSSSLPAICSQSPLPRIVYPHRHPSLGSSPPKTIPPHLLPVLTQPHTATQRALAAVGSVGDS